MKLRNKKKETIIITAIIVAVIIAIVLAIVLISSLITGSNNKKNEVTGIQLSIYPYKTTYYVGETFDPAGLTIQVLANSNEASYYVEHTDPELKITGFDSTAVNDALTLTVTYRNFTTTFNVTIKERPVEMPHLTEIRISDNMKVKYSLNSWTTYGMKLDNVKIICTYSDGSEKEVPLYIDYCTGVDYNITSAGNQVITVTYSDSGYTATTTVTITITN